MNKKSQQFGKQFVGIRVSQKDACLSYKTGFLFRQESSSTPFFPSLTSSSSFAILLLGSTHYYLFSGLDSCFPTSSMEFLTNQLIIGEDRSCPRRSLVPPHCTQLFRKSIQLKLKSEALSEPFPAAIQVFKKFFFSDQAKYRAHIRWNKFLLMSWANVSSGIVERYKMLCVDCEAWL